MKKILLLLSLLSFFPLQDSFAQEAAPVALLTIKGVVKEKGTRKYLGGVNVFLLPQGDSAVTDEKGEFVFENIKPGKYEISALLINYKKYGPEIITLEGNKEISIYLEKELISMMEIVVETEREKREEVSHRPMQKEEAQKIAGSGGDVLKALENLPGVTTANELGGGIYVRGSDQRDNIYIMDKMFIGYPYHFGGLTSSVNTDIVRSVDFYAGGFGSKFIDVQGGMGGVIDINTRAPRQDRLGGKFDISTAISSLSFEGPISKKSSFYLTGRRSYIELFTPKTDDLTVIPVFQDYQGKVIYNLSEKTDLGFNFFGSNDNIYFSSTQKNRKDPTLSSTTTSYDQQFHTQGLTLKSTLTPKLTSDLIVSYAIFNQDFNLNEDLSVELRSREARVWEEIILDMDNHKITTGIRAGRGWWKTEGKFTRPPLEGDSNYNFSEEEKVIAVGKNNSAWGAAYYLEDAFQLTDSFKIIPGGQLLYFEPTNDKRFAPRLALRYKILKECTLKGAWGVYHQSPSYEEFDPEWGNPRLKFNESVHYVAGLEKIFTPAIDLDIQVYYKDFDKLVVRSPNPAEIYCNCGKGFAYGTEFFLRHKLKDRFFGWFSYTYSISKRKDRVDEDWRLFTEDRTHIITIAANYQFTAKWNIGTKWHYVTGSLYTPVIDKIYNADKDVYIPLHGETNSQRVPATHRMDLRIERKTNYDTWILNWYLDLWNIYYHANPVGVSYNWDYSKVEVFRFLPFFAMFGVSAEF